jgi:hypothetical protein
MLQRLGKLRVTHCASLLDVLAYPSGVAEGRSRPRCVRALGVLDASLEARHGSRPQAHRLGVT